MGECKATNIDASYLWILNAYRLIALMLGRLKMTVQDCLDEYERLMEKVFGSGWVHIYLEKPFRYLTTDKFYSATDFEKVVKDLLSRRLPE